MLQEGERESPTEDSFNLNISMKGRLKVFLLRAAVSEPEREPNQEDDLERRLKPRKSPHGDSG